jgi:MoxR-like ATPase
VDVEGLTAALEERAYLADRPLALALHLALHLGRPLLLEGEAGVGKTEAAKALADVLGAELIRLQCYEGIDRAQALYAWDHPRQLVHLRVLESGGGPVAEDALYDERFLLERPLLRALRAGRRAVLLIDEVDRADEEFEAFLLEVLSDFQVSIPELGTVRAAEPPVVVLTSNRTRELSDALKRRCLYHWIEMPRPDRELRILRLRVPEVPEATAALVTEVVGRLRTLGLYKPPGPAETIDWARVVLALGGGVDVSGATGRAHALELLAEALGVVVKDHEDLELVRSELGALLGG